MNLPRRDSPDATCEHLPAELPEPQAAACQECGSRVSIRLCAMCWCSAERRYVG